MSYIKAIGAFFVNIRISQPSKVMFTCVLRLTNLTLTSKECINCIMLSCLFAMLSCLITSYPVFCHGIVLKHCAILSICLVIVSKLFDILSICNVIVSKHYAILSVWHVVVSKHYAIVSVYHVIVSKHYVILSVYHVVVFAHFAILPLCTLIMSKEIISCLLGMLLC